jgi:hypothetical protein
LVQRGTVVVVRNFVAAQRRWDDEEVSPSPTPDNEAATTEQPSSNEVTTTEQRTGNEAATKSPRPSNEAATKSPRPSNEAATKPELSARKHEDEIASARARALSLDLSREDKSTSKKDRDVEQPPSGSPPAPPAVLTLSDSKSNSPKPDSAISEVRKLFAHWQSVMEHPRSVLDPKRERLLQQSIARHGFEDCWRAIDGCKADPWHQGANDRGTRFDGLELIFRDVAHVEKFVGYLDPSRAKFVDPRKGIAPAAPASAFAEATAARKGISRDIFGEHLARKASNQ